MKCGFGRIPSELREGKIVTSPSKIGHILNSPKHYHYNVIEKKQETTPAMEEGTMIHKYLLEPEDFFEHYCLPLKKSDYLVTVDDIKEELTGHSLSGLKNKESLINYLLQIKPDAKIWDVEIEKIQNSGKKIITEWDYEMLKGLKQSLDENVLATKMFEGAQCEVEGWFTDEDTGVIITFKIDIYNQSLIKPIVIDLKKVRNINQREMDKWLYNSGAYIQLAMYRDAIVQIENLTHEPLCGILACEVDGPFIVQPFAIDFGSLEAGRVQYKKALHTLVECYETGNWSAHNNGITNMALPSWAFNQIDLNEEKELEG